MKKMIFCALICGITASVNAQISFGAQGGGTVSSLRFTSGGIETHSEAKAGYLFGAVANVPLGGMISFRPELNFIRKGGQNEAIQTLGGITVQAEQETSLSYIQLAPNFVYNLSAGKGKFFFGLGPEISAGIGGKYESFVKTEFNTGSSIITDTQTQKGDIEFDSDGGVGNLKRFDFGANGIAGYKWNNGFFASLGYSHGFANILPEGDDDNNLRNRSAFLKIGYMFK